MISDCLKKFEVQLINREFEDKELQQVIEAHEKNQKKDIKNKLLTIKEVINRVESDLDSSQFETRADAIIVSLNLIRLMGVFREWLEK